MRPAYGFDEVAIVPGDYTVNPDQTDVDHIKMSQIKLDTKEFEFIDNKKIKQLGTDSKVKYPSEQK